jgi:hypothetical protein
MSETKRWVKFTKEEEALIREHYPKDATMSDLASYIGCSAAGVYNYCRRHGIIAKENTFWNSERVQYIKDNYGKCSASKIAEHFTNEFHTCRTHSVNTKIQELRKKGIL